MMMIVIKCELLAFIVFYHSYCDVWFCTLCLVPYLKL